VVNNKETLIFAINWIHMNFIVKNMKKVILILMTFVTIAIVATSCMSTQGCAAYGERSRYQIERR